MRKIFYFCFVAHLIVAQSQSPKNCGLDFNPLQNPNARLGDIVDWASYLPNVNTVVKKLRLNVFFVQKDDGSGNFTETTDGNGNSNYNGYKYLADVLNFYYSSANNKSNSTMPPGNSIQNLPTKIEFEVESVNFIKNTSVYNNTTDIYGQGIINSQIGINRTRSINMFLIGPAWFTGNATIGNIEKYITMAGTWQRYQNDLLTPEGPNFQRWWGYDIFGKTIFHELGHDLSLYHTMNTGACNSEDYCSDTPLGSVIQTQFGYNPCCQWNGVPSQCTNNLMSYNNGNALTPCQLGRMHWTIENEVPLNKLCSYALNTLNVTTIGYPQVLYQARTITVSNASDPLKSGEKALIVGQNSIELLPGFEAQLGSELELRIETACN